MSEKCEKCGKPKGTVLAHAYGTHCMRTGGEMCLRDQLAQARADRDLAETALSRKHAEVATEKNRADKAEAERDAWRNIIAMLCGDGGQYHQQHGTAATVEYCKTRFYDLVKRAEKAEAERNELFFASDELQCDIASALGWDCHGIVFHRLVRGYVMAHEMERAEVGRLRERQKDDEGLIQRAIEALSTGIALPCRDATIAEMGLTIDALRTRLGEVPAQGEEAKDEQAPNAK